MFATAAILTVLITFTDARAAGDNVSIGAPENRNGSSLSTYECCKNLPTSLQEYMHCVIQIPDYPQTSAFDIIKEQCHKQAPVVTPCTTNQSTACCPLLKESNTNTTMYQHCIRDLNCRLKWSEVSPFFCPREYSEVIGFHKCLEDYPEDVVAQDKCNEDKKKLRLELIGFLKCLKENPDDVAAQNECNENRRRSLYIEDCCSNLPNSVIACKSCLLEVNRSSETLKEDLNGSSETPKKEIGVFELIEEQCPVQSLEVISCRGEESIACCPLLRETRNSTTPYKNCLQALNCQVDWREVLFYVCGGAYATDYQHHICMDWHPNNETALAHCLEMPNRMRTKLKNNQTLTIGSYE